LRHTPEVCLKTLLIVAALLALAAGDTVAAPVIVVGENAVTITSVTPGGEVVLFACDKRALNGGTRASSQQSVLHDTDHDGVVSLQTQPAFRSVWIAVDSTTGAVAAGAPFPLEIYPITSASLARDSAGAIVRFEVELSRMAMLVIRPGGGAWIARGWDGAEQDRDGMGNGRLSLAFADAVPVTEGDPAAPAALRSGDVIAAVDLGRLEVYLGTVTQ
jgi:hypothetical protein